jgi:chemotaxis protein MotB
MSSGPRRDPHQEEGPSQERWLVSYADFITLMFAFFAVLYATSEKNLDKAKELQDSVKKYLIKAGSFGDSGQQIQQGQKNNAIIEPPIQTYKDGRPETVELLDKAEEFIETQLTKEERKKFVRDIGADDWGVRIVMPSDVLYSKHSEKFRAEALPFITKLSDLIAKTKRKVLIEGHVSAGESGTFRSTWDFSSARAVNMLRFMQAKQKFPGNQLAAAAMGDSRPAYEAQNAEGNSRIELVLLNHDMDF